MEEIQECLALAKRQGVLPPVRIARILAGEHAGQFSNDRIATKENQRKNNVPLSVALEYIGTILEESRKEIARLKSEVEEYNQLCNSMEDELHSLLRVSQILPPAPVSNDNTSTASNKLLGKLSIDDLYAKVRADDADQFAERILAADAREAFWREMNQSEDSFETISRFFAKGVIS
jgi:vacuolar protein sorting-associated protein 11